MKCILYFFLPLVSSFSFMPFSKTSSCFCTQKTANSFIISTQKANTVKELPVLYKLYDNIVPEEQRVEVGEKVVRYTTGFLPNADSIGHTILHNNDKVINFILDLDVFSLEQKKKIILTIIDLSRHGDDFGSLILSNYHDIVNHVLTPPTL